jgi:hypothetical protein
MDRKQEGRWGVDSIILARNRLYYRASVNTAMPSHQCYSMFPSQVQVSHVGRITDAIPEIAES